MLMHRCEEEEIITRVIVSSGLLYYNVCCESCLHTCANGVLPLSKRCALYMLEIS